MTMINEIVSMSPIMTMSISMILPWILKMNLFMIMMFFFVHDRGYNSD